MKVFRRKKKLIHHKLVLDLFIDTTNFNKVTFILSDGKKSWEKFYKINPHRSHETLQKLDKFLKSASIKPPPVRQRRTHSPNGTREEERVSKIIVNTGPGSFTGIRVGIVLAQALGLAWKIPIKFLEKKQFVKELQKV